MHNYRISAVGIKDAFRHLNYCLARTLVRLPVSQNLSMGKFIRGLYRGYIIFQEDVVDENLVTQFEEGDRIFFQSIRLRYEEVK